MTGRRFRGRWIAILSAFVAACVAVAGISEAVRFLRETRAIRALASDVAAERIAALEVLASIGNSRALRGILGSLSLPTPETEGLFLEKPSEEMYSLEPGRDSWELHCAVAVYFGKNAVPLLRSLLRSGEPRERYWALRFLWRIPDLAPEGPGPALLDLLDDPDSRVRGEAVLAVGLAATTKPLLQERLAQDLHAMHSSGRYRAAAAMALSVAACEEEERQAPDESMVRFAAEALMRAAGNDVTAVRAECARGLCAIENRWSFRQPSLAREIRQFLATRLSEPELDVWSTIAASLRETAAIPALIHVLEEGPPEARRGAVEVLRSIGLDHRGLLPLLEHPDPEVRSQAAKALSWSVNIDAGMLEQTVLEVLAEARTDLLRRTACEVAPSLGPAAVKAVPLLAALIEAEPWDGRPFAALALGDIGPAARSALPSLAAAVVGRDPDLAVEAIGALGKISPEGCAEMLARGLRHPSDRVQDAALGVLWGLGPAAAPALPALRELAGNANAAELVSLLESR